MKSFYNWLIEGSRYWGPGKSHRRVCNAIKDRAKAIDAWAKTTKERAMSAAARVVEEYKDSDNSVTNATKAGKGVYIFRFEDWKKMVIEAYLTLDFHGIIASGEEEGEAMGEEEGIVKEEVGEAEEQASEEAITDREFVEVLAFKATTIMVPEEAASALKA